MNNVFPCLSKLNSNLRLLGNVTFKSSINKLTSRVQNFSTNNMANQGNTAELIFKGTEDRYNGITVDTLKEHCSTDTFHRKLEDSLKSWISSQKRGIWFKVALEHSEWVPILAKNGFDFHHANNGFVMMYRWLPATICGIPPFAHTMVAVGALVLNDKLEVLAVQEKHFITEHWKFPGGVVEPGENLINAAIREVKEETNIDCEFRSVVSMTHAPKGMFGCTDLYLIMGMHAITTDIKACEREIAKCQWIHIDEYIERDDVTHFNKSLISKYLEYQKNGVRIGFEEGIHNISNRSYVTYKADMTQFKL